MQEFLYCLYTLCGIVLLLLPVWDRASFMIAQHGSEDIIWKCRGSALKISLSRIPYISQGTEQADLCFLPFPLAEVLTIYYIFHRIQPSEQYMFLC